MLTVDRRIDRRILLQAESLKAAGWEVVIVAPPSDADVGQDGFDVRVTRASNRPGARQKAIGWAANLRRRMKVGERSTRVLRAMIWRFMLEPEAFFQSLLLETALQYHPSVFVAHDLPTLPVARRAAEASGAKLVYDSHELYPDQGFADWERALWCGIEGRHIRSCDAVITVNQSIAAEIERRYGLASVNVILNAERRAPMREKPRLFHRRLNLPFDAKVVLFQGGLMPSRNLDVLLRATPLLRTSDLHLVFLGDGPVSGQLRRKAQQLRIAQRVHFLPAVPQRELLAWTSSADLGVIPYTANCLNNYLCTPNKLFEFVSAGIPMVASDLPELKRFVRGYEIGLIGDTSSPASFAMMIDEIFSTPGLIERLRSKVEFAQEVLNWEIESQSLLSVYARVLSCRADGGRALV